MIVKLINDNFYEYEIIKVVNDARVVGRSENLGDFDSISLKIWGLGRLPQLHFPHQRTKD